MTTIRLRRGTASGAAANNYVLDAGEPGFETDTGVVKVGDGSTAWANLRPIGAAPVFNVREYGAVGDGVTDDTAALQATLVAARAVKGIVRLSTGRTYIVSGPLDPAGCILEGHAATLKVKAGTTPTYTVLTPSGACTIDGLTVDGNKANTTDPANQAQGGGLLMALASWDGLILRGVTIKDCHQLGVQIYSTNGGTSGDTVTNCPTLLDDVSVNNCTVGNVAIKTVAGVTIRNCDASASPSGIGFYFSVVGKSKITGCTSTGNTSGIFAEYCTDVLIEGNICESNTSQGIAVGGGSTTLQENRYITVRGNICRNNATIGITVDPTKAGAPNTWVAVYANVQGNLCVDNVTTGINVENAAYVNVTGNTSHSNGGDGLRIVGAYCLADANILTSNTGAGLSVYGVATFDNGHHRFGANTAIGNTGGDFALADIASGTVVDVETRIPGSLKSYGNLHAQVGSVLECYMGAAGPGGQAGMTLYTEMLYVPSTGSLRTGSQMLIESNVVAGYNGTGGWDAGHVLIGGYHLWVDSLGKLRIKSGSPASDTDGVIVGTQA